MVDFMYSGSVRTTSRRFKILRQAAVTLGIARLVDAIGEELIASETDQAYPNSNTHLNHFIRINLCLKHF